MSRRRAATVRPAAAVSQVGVQAFAGAPPLGSASGITPLFRTAKGSSPAVSVLMPDATGRESGGLAPVLPTGRTQDRRRVAEAYRQPFGREYTRRRGRPVGWLLAFAAIEKVFFPTALLIMLMLRHWEALGLTIACETLIGLTALVLVTRGKRLQYFFKGLAIIPLRYALIVMELVTLGRFAADLWITKNRNWRK
jgi:hypothetical protein